MRKLVVAGVLAAAALLAIPASAAFDHHFSVISRPVSGHVVGGTKFVFKEKLFDPHHRRDKVGRDWAVCKDQHHTTKCRAHIHLNGEIGGFGDIGGIGRLGPTDRRLNVAWGTRDFKEVAGKVTIHDAKGNAAKLRFDLVR